MTINEFLRLISDGIEEDIPLNYWNLAGEIKCSPTEAQAIADMVVEFIKLHRPMEEVKS